MKKLISAAAVMLFVIGIPQAKTSQTIPWNQLGSEAAKQCGGKGLAVTELWNGYRLECRMQALQAEVTMSGAKIISTSKSEGGGEFTIRTSKLGRSISMKELSGVVDWMAMKEGVVQTGRADIVEEYTTSGDGIRQDFVISDKPEGQGKLLLDLAIEGAVVTTKTKQGEIELRLSSGRALAYHALKVTDATGQELASSFIKSGNNVITIAVDDKNGSYPVRIDPTITDADWVSMGGISGVAFGAVVYAIAFDDSGNLYAGGNFDSAGGVPANHIAQWNGSTWSALGSGTNGDVRALAVDRSGNLYAGGWFTTAGGVAASHIAKWDGNTWSALGNGTDSTVQALAIDDSVNLYAGGYFHTAGGTAANRIAKWNGSSWSALGTGMSNPPLTIEGSYVCALALDNFGNLYAGGYFDTAGGVPVNNIAKWNGSSWSALGFGSTMFSIVWTLAVDGSGNLYAGDQNIAKWNGSSWSALGATNYNVRALAVDDSGNLYAGGTFTSVAGIAANNIAKWNGSSWSALGNGFLGYGIGFMGSSEVFAIVVNQSDHGLYAGGWSDAYSAGGGPMINIAKWNGSSWGALGTGINNFVRAFTADRSSHSLYLGGGFNSVDGVSANYIAKWNGSAWSALGSGTNSCVNALAVDSSSNLYAGGYFDTAGGVPANRIAKWDGSSWSPLGSGMNGWVYSLAVDLSGNLYVGGYFPTAGGGTVNGIFKWNGRAWSTLGRGINGEVDALAFDDSGNLYAGGNFDSAGGVPANYIAQWNGSTWSALGSGTNGDVRALAVDTSGDIYAGGVFDTVGGATANYIVKWNGNAWSALGSGTNNYIYTLAVDNSENLYAGGYFTTAGGAAANHIAKWDGSTWSALGSGTNNYINALAVDSSENLYAGGGFTIAGGNISAYAAMCKLNGTAVIPRRGDNVSRPFMAYDARANLMRFQLKAQTQITYRIYSLLGRQVFQASETMGVGDHSMRINTGHAARGVYIVHFKAGSESLRFRMVVDR